MEAFLGMEVEQPGKVIKLHLDSYVQEVLKVYKKYIRKSLRPKRVSMSLGPVLDNDDCLNLPDPRKQKYYHSFLAKLQFAASWIRFDISFSISSDSHWLDVAHPSPQGHRTGRH